jgi:quercetin dioxygenase-like cupin family protein
MKVLTISDVRPAVVQSEAASGARARVLIGKEDGAPTFTMRLFDLEPGGHTPRHVHAHEHEIIVQSGEGTLWTESTEYPLAPGTVALVGPDELHQFRAGSRGMSFFCLVPHEGHK